MRFLSVAEQELRVAARRKGTHRLRWMTGGGFIAFVIWLGWAMDLFTRQGMASRVFGGCLVVLFLYCLFVGAAATADCISRERREGTLGLLFLTNLNSVEIVAGKLCSNGIALIYSLLGVFPILAILLMLGGITFEVFCHTTLVLADTIFLSVAAGFVASTICLRQFPAVALATGLAIFFGMCLIPIAEVLRHYGCAKSITESLKAICPLQTLLIAQNPLRFTSIGNYWVSLGAVAGLAFTWLLLVAWRLKYIWRDRPRTARTRRVFGLKLFPSRRLNNAGAAVRTRLLNINPLYWLAGRQRVSAPIFMILVVLLFIIGEWVATPYFTWLFRGAGAMAPVAAQAFTLMWIGILVHVLVLYYAANAASQQLAEDKHSGALELILSTPISPRTIGRGLWLAYARKMLFPALAAVFAHILFLWQCVFMITMDPHEFGNFPRSITPLQLIRGGLFDVPINGYYFEWQFVMVARMGVMILAALAAIWLAFGWLGRWLGLRMKHPGFAPIVCLVLAFVPPGLVFSVGCYLGEQWHLDRLPERQIVPLTMWLAFGLVFANSALLALWAAGRLRRDFRTVVIGRFEPSLRPWWRPSGRSVFILARRAVATATALALMVGLFYVYQNSQSRRRWNTFQKELAKRGESLDLDTALPPLVPAAQNFAQSEPFKTFVNTRNTNQPIGVLRRQLGPQVMAQVQVANSAPPLWIRQWPFDFNIGLAWIQPGYKPGTYKDRKLAAAAALNILKPAETNLAAIAAASQLPYFQATTNRHWPAVTLYNLEEIYVMEQLHSLYLLRSEALLLAGQAPEAANDLLTSVRMAALVRQSPDGYSSQRVQLMLTQSLQPLWEGLVEHRWNDSQLAKFQHDLAQFNLLADHTNALHRVVLACIEDWRNMPDRIKAGNISPGRTRPDLPLAGWQPSSWWFDYSITFYTAGQQAASRVDAANGQVRPDNRWIDLGGLPLHGFVDNLFQQQIWMGTSPVLVAFAQNALNEAVIACALERYRLANGRYPSSLDELLPAYLEKIPVDVLNGQPMFYRAADVQTYTLRGVGPNGVIDKPGPTTDDWVWSSSFATNSTAKKVEPVQ